MHGIVEQKLCTCTFIGTIIWNQSNFVILFQNKYWNYVEIDQSNTQYSSKNHNDMV